jgi:predicted anti-sigma-YlaC factor YlaD
MDPRTTFRSCDRAREAASGLLDGELSPFEARLLEAHVERCADCRAFQASAARTAVELRAAPLERLTYPIVLPRRRLLRPMQGSAAAAMAAAAVLVLTVASPVDFDRVPTSRLAVPATSSDESRIVPDGDPLPTDYMPTPEANGNPIPE